MNEELFADLLESVREGGAIIRGDKDPSRQFIIEEPDVKHIREEYKLSQSQFALLLGISSKNRAKLGTGKTISPRDCAGIIASCG